jgi:hypothetical protein
VKSFRKSAECHERPRPTDEVGERPLVYSKMLLHARRSCDCRRNGCGFAGLANRGPKPPAGPATRRREQASWRFNLGLSPSVQQRRATSRTAIRAVEPGPVLLTFTKLVPAASDWL